jgi:hypothetical protein
LATTTEVIAKENCVFCGAELTQNANQIQFPITFTAYQLLQAGNKACLQCIEMFTKPQYRRNCWILKDGKIKVIEHPLEFLLDLPEPPFLLYLTKSKRKHGWIRTVQNPTLSTKRFILVVDEEKIMFDAKVYADLYAFCKRLTDSHLVPKTILLGGMPQPSLHRKYGLVWADCFRLRELQYNPLWRVIVEFKRRD